MPRNIYIVKSGDILPNVSRQFYGVANRVEEIINSNQFLQFRRDSGDSDLSGVPNIYENDSIVVLTESPIVSVSPDVAQPDTLTLFINGNETPLPEGSELVLNYDTCCNTFSAVFPWDPMDDFDRLTWDPDNMPELDLFIGTKQVFGGKVETMDPDPSVDNPQIPITARTHTYLIQKSVCPSMGYPVERENESLEQIAAWLCGFFKLRVDAIDSPANPFKKASLENSTLGWQFLSNLATTRRRVMNSTDDGRGFRIVSPENAESVQRFEQGIDGFECPKFHFNTANLLGTYLATVETTKSPDYLVGYKDPNFQETSYGFVDLKDAIAGDAQDALEYEARKRYRDYLSTEISPGEGILNPKGAPWMPGDMVTIKAPVSMIYEDFDFMIRSVTYPLRTTQDRAVLTIIPPQVYSGTEISPRPWKRS